MNVKKVNIGSLIEFVTGSLLRYVKEDNQHLDDSVTTLIEDKEDSIISMDRFAKINGLDDKQSMAFKIVCSTFILDCIERDIYNYQGGVTRNSGMRDTVSNVLNDVSKKTLKLLVKDLKRCGGKGHLIMFLSGKEVLAKVIQCSLLRSIVVISVNMYQYHLKRIKYCLQQ